MLDLTKITPEQANKIECALIMLESSVIEKIEGYELLIKDETYSASTLELMKSNMEWWREVYQLLYGNYCKSRLEAK